MKRRIFSQLLSVVLCPSALFALDLTPAEGFRELEGFRIPVVRFADGTRKVVYQPPTGWRLSGGGESLNILPPDREGAAVQLRALKRPEQADGNVAEDFDAWARSQLPPAAGNIEKVGAAEGQFTIAAQPSRARTFSYSVVGRRFFASVAAVDLNDTERLTVVITAREPDFKAMQDEAVASFFSWQWDDE
jgi:hypothetical protein